MPSKCHELVPSASEWSSEAKPLRSLAMKSRRLQGLHVGIRWLVKVYASYDRKPMT